MSVKERIEKMFLLASVCMTVEIFQPYRSHAWWVIPKDVKVKIAVKYLYLMLQAHSKSKGRIHLGGIIWDLMY